MESSRERERERWDTKVHMREKATRKLMEDKETITTKLSSIDSFAAETGETGINQRRLLSELDSSLEEEDATNDDEAKQEEKDSSKEIIKELKNIQRQNTITHFLLTASILVTLAWQLSEFSLILRIKQGFNNPLRSIGGAIKGLFNASIQNTEQKQIQVIPPTYIPGLKIPDWPGFDTSNEEEDDD